jgi:putative membrane protein
MELTAKKSKNLRRLIVVLSIIIPLAVAALFGIHIKGIDLTFLPSIYAGINALTAVLLVVALVLVKKRKLKLHEQVIKVCMALSVLFLLCYVAYHMTSDSTVFGDTSGDGILQETEKLAISSASRLFYFLLLITHIILSVAVVPMVLYSFLFATEGNFVRHRKWTRITWPIWFYVAVSGVIVYFMISPYYH